MKLAFIHEKLGSFDEADSDFISAFKYSISASDSIDVYIAQIDYYRHRGQIKAALHIKEQLLNTVQNAYPPYVSIFKLMHVNLYLLISEDETALEIINQVDGQIMESYQGIEYEAYLKYHIHQKDIKRSEEVLELLRSGIPENGYPESYLPYWEGEIFYIKEDFDSALSKYRKFIVDSDDYAKNETNIKIANCLIELDRIEDAINHIFSIIETYPYRAEAHLLLARILIDQNKNEKAKEHLVLASQVWEKADSVYSYAQETKRLLEEL